ncbi:hypothetical protein Ctob_000334 [Chrysochromulina tobinii]|uniref:PDZ domain-containing protein n=1 Tax=Chrysochromulina tobinii TaxID=1460289 RepID=A0A0M0JBR2_9EUKA|nr:hypothetical protein Ctob_000334 [Chrysochromulina tobinii]|eukprot:KOO23930.1 hypothetical protein Ctob_000334 [Chrysochromulina sp. CCMP291]
MAPTQLSSACAAPAPAKRRTRVRWVLGAFGRKSPSPSDYPSAVEPAAESGAQYDAPRLPGQGTSLSLAPSTTLGICAAALASPLHRPPPRLLLTPPPAHLGLGGLVVGLAEGGIALAAGALKKGMLIKAVNGEPVGSASDAAAKLKAAFPEVKLLVFTPPAGAPELTDPFDDADGEWGEPLKPKRFSVFGKQRAKAPKTSRVEVAKDAHRQAERSPFKAVQPVPDSKHSPSKNNKNVAYAPPQKLFAVGAIAAIEPVRPAP